MSIDLHIERLVIDAALLRGERPAAVRAAIERALTRQLAHPGSIDALRGIGTVASLPSVALPASRHPGQDLGTRVANAVQQRLGLPGGSASGKH
jgi:hypothetical protein